MADPGWTPADERRLGDHMQEAIRRDSPAQAVNREDEDVRKILRNVREVWGAPDDDDDQDEL